MRVVDPAAFLQQRMGASFAVNEVPIVYADVIDAASLVAMCSKSRVVINCVGPVRAALHRLPERGTDFGRAAPVSPARQFSQYGEPVVRACVQTGCDYVDITGEPLVRTMHVCAGTVPPAQQHRAATWTDPAHTERASCM
jgi:hypothetical protein